MLRIAKTIRNNRGIALLLTISVTTILVALALEYNRRARFAVLSTAVTRDRLTLSHVASSGIHAAMALLAKDRAESNIDSLQEDWANSDKINELLNEISFDAGTLAVTIADEMGRIQINSLVTFPDSRNFNESQRLLLERYLNYFKDDTEETPEDSQPSAIINSLKDWLDSGDDEAITGLSGAESSYYQDLSPSYGSRNGPISDINDLLLVKGITPELFYGSSEKPGIVSFLTVYGLRPGAGTSFSFPGKINVNTAELPVLVAMLPSENVDMAQAFYDLRQEAATNKDADVSDTTWYKDIAGTSGINLDTNLVTTASDIFRILSVAKVNNTELTVTAVVQRTQNAKSGKWTCKILSYQTES